MKQEAGKAPSYRLELLELEEGEKAPKAALYILDRSFKVIDKKKISGRGEFSLPEKAIEEGCMVALGPDIEKLEKIDKKLFTVYRGTQFRELVEERGMVSLRRESWLQWLTIDLTVSGSVKHCYPWPILYQYLQKDMFAIQKEFMAKAIPEPIAERFGVKTFNWREAYPQPMPIWKCDTVCDGLVEVYRRNCCCGPWIVYDPRLPRLVEALEDLVKELPEIPWPPEPDPGPYMKDVFFRDGAVDELTINAVKDLAALRNLSPETVPQYISERKYLHSLWCCCCCTMPQKVAQGFIRPDGTFEITWNEPLRLMLINCHDEYAFKVRQNIDGNLVTIYNGICSGQWFDYGEESLLRSYHPDAQGCRHNEFPGTGAFALLQDIGLTGSYNLKTPDAKAWDSVEAPAEYNDGLCFPATSAIAAKGKYLDRNWGGLLRLRYHFSEEMKAAGAEYYRVSVVKANGSGNPTGARTNLNTSSWKYYKILGTEIYVEKVALGPHKVGAQTHLYKIPYDADKAWHSGQYHALLDSTKYLNGRHLVTLELFDSAGNLIRPAGTPNPGGSVEKSFTYRRWYQETGATSEVPFACLTHMLWWDNRKAVAKIEDFRVNGSASANECQFRSGNATDNFSCGYRAYHLEPMFMLNHKLWWRRGMGTPYASGILTVPSWNPNNVAVPPAVPFTSGNATLQEMLGSGDSGSKCTFTMNLHVNVKTFNGIGTLDSLDAWDQGSFALEIN